MKNKIKFFFLIIVLLLNIYLIINVIVLNNELGKTKQEFEKVNNTLEIQNDIIVELQKDYNTLKFEIDK